MWSRHWNSCRKWWMRCPVTALLSSRTKARSRGSTNSVTDGFFTESSACVAETATDPLDAAGSSGGVGFLSYAPDDRAVGAAKTEVIWHGSDDGPQSRLFNALSRELLRAGNAIRFEARGASMSPAIRDGEVVHVKAAPVADLRVGDIVLVKGEMGFRMHRLVVADAERDVFITRGDCGQQDDPAVSGEEVVGVAESKEVRVGRSVVRAKLRGMAGRLLCGAARSQRIARRWFDRVSTFSNGMRSRVLKGAGVSSLFFVVLFVLFAAAYSSAQVVVDASTSGTASPTGTGTSTLSFAHTTANTANRVLLVGVSLNITNAPTTALTGVTYNGVALTFVGAHNDANNTRRVEMWYQLAPSTGTHQVIVTINIPAAVSVGMVAGATTFTGVDQTVPLGIFTSADGANGGNSQLDAPSVVNGMILDTLATDGTQTVGVSSPQVSQWNANSAN